MLNQNSPLLYGAVDSTVDCATLYFWEWVYALQMTILMVRMMDNDNI